MGKLRATYRVVRSVLFTVVLVAVCMYIGLYVFISLPPVQRIVKDRLSELGSDFLGASLSCESIDIRPFNEVRLHGVRLLTPDGRRCVDIETLGAGINIWHLVSDRKIELTYAEIVGLDARLWQDGPDSAINIAFIIDAFAPKDKSKPPAEFDLKLHNVVIRRSRLSWDRKWIAASEDSRKIDFNHIRISDLKADIALPRIANNDFSIDLRRLAFQEVSGFALESLSCKAYVTDRMIDVRDLLLKLPGSEIPFSDIHLDFNGFDNIVSAIKNDEHSVSIRHARLTPADFSAFLPSLFPLQSPYMLDVEAKGNQDLVLIDGFALKREDGAMNLEMVGNVSGLSEMSGLEAAVRSLTLSAGPGAIASLLMAFAGDKPDVASRISGLGSVSANLEGAFRMSDKALVLSGDVDTDAGDVVLDVRGFWKDARNLSVRGRVSVSDVDLARLVGDQRLGQAALDLDADVTVSGGDLSGQMMAEIPFIDFKGNRIENIHAEGNKDGNVISGKISVDDGIASLDAVASCVLAGERSQWRLDADIEEFHPDALGLVPALGLSRVGAKIHADIAGNYPDNFTGGIAADDISFSSKRGDLSVRHLNVSGSMDSSGFRHYMVDSDFCNAEVRSDASVSEDVEVVRTLLAHVFPNVFAFPRQTDTSLAGRDFSLTLTLHPVEDLYVFLGSPLRPLTPVILTAGYDAVSGVLSANMNAPYLLQGKNKLLKSFAFDASVSETNGLQGSASLNMPVKNDRADISVSMSGRGESMDLGLGWKGEKNSGNFGKVNMRAAMIQDAFSGERGTRIDILESAFRLSGEEWTVSPATLSYIGKRADIDNVRIWHDAQFIKINGSASPDPLDMITLDLAGVDLQYVFDVLNINYVNFGGVATGRVTASDVFTKRPVLRTERLAVDNLAYNGAVLGDAELESHWDVDEKMVAINADIVEDASSSAKVRGGVYITRDSLSFDFYTNHTNIECLQPFMSGFTSRVKGRASGHLKLYGTFSDVDLGGRVHADTISLLVDQTNVVYSASDSVFFTPGRITIPCLTLYDKYGNHARLQGEVRHDFLHDARFRFDITDASHLLVFDTDASDNGVWYGRVFADGNAALRGAPGYVSLDGTLSSAPGSSFTFVLDEKETAVDYDFLTFTDRRKEEALKMEETVEETIEDRFSRSIAGQIAEQPTAFLMNISLSVTPDATINIVMDPDAGDRIAAKGNGALRFQYDTASDDLRMYGKYVLEKGTYNFSLQDLILRNFTIRNGSSIAFNGDPMQGVLDISAAYRVNTNITDLDRSFVNDPDLNRSNVPVDAILNVRGEISTPEIKFDLDLPTMTPEVERKIRSIISTEEMLNIQVIYLLALNRFYTPEYSGSGQGGELASVASSTLSSQISNIIGSLTDKFTLAPSFKSDRNDFSDLEFDVALSSSLFNNRLLINGNLGYRDRTTSLTTFVGDFDIEYLLNHEGSLRLKAYNHFNDASYYLKSALTTQGLGVIYRKEFDNPFTFLRRKKKKK